MHDTGVSASLGLKSSYDRLAYYASMHDDVLALVKMAAMRFPKPEIVGRQIDFHLLKQIPSLNLNP